MDNLTPASDIKARASLDAALAGFRRPLVALSGGVDSVLLAARVAAMARGGAAATLVGSLFAMEEVDRARAAARTFGLPLHEVPLDALALEDVRTNPPDRCYHCKKSGFGALAALAREKGYGVLLDGQNVDDVGDYRPGARAAAELGVRSPLREAGFTKAMIRRWSRELGLPTADTPSAACLASRVPYGTPLTAELLARIDRAEAFLRGLGFGQLSVRHHGEVARIEAGPEDFDRLVADPLRTEIVRVLKDLGYRHVALDLEGYRTGSLNPPSVTACAST